MDFKKTSIVQIEFYRQVCLRDGTYNPTIAPKQCNGYLECWPDAPLWDQIMDGDNPTLRCLDFESYWCSYYVDTVTLQQGPQFDDVVLAIPLGAFKKMNAAPGPCDELIEASDRFRAMTEMATLVRALPCRPGATAMRPNWDGRHHCSDRWALRKRRSYPPARNPLDIWADMSQVLKYEPWPLTRTARSRSSISAGARDRPSARPPTTFMFLRKPKRSLVQSDQLVQRQGSPYLAEIESRRTL